MAGEGGGGRPRRIGAGTIDRFKPGSPPKKRRVGKEKGKGKKGAKESNGAGSKWSPFRVGEYVVADWGDGEHEGQVWDVNEDGTHTVAFSVGRVTEGREVVVYRMPSAIMTQAEDGDQHLPMEEDEDREHEQGTAMEVTKSRAKQRKKRSALLRRAAKQVSCRAPRPRRRVSPLP